MPLEPQVRIMRREGLDIHSSTLSDEVGIGFAPRSGAMQVNLWCRKRLNDAWV